MILASHGIIASQIASFDADYTAILAYATTQGYTLPSAAQRIKQNQLVVDLKAAGVWNKLDSFAVFATNGNSNFALIDWKRLSQYTAVNSPTFTSNQGFAGNGTSSYVNTNYNPNTNAVNLSLNSTSIGGYKFNTSTALTCDLGCIETSPVVLRLHFSANGGIGVNSTAFYIANTTAQAVSQGTFALIRDNSGDFDYYKDSVKTAYATQVASSVGIPSLNLFAFARNTNGTASQFAADTLSIIYAGSQITSEYGDFVDALDNYITSL